MKSKEKKKGSESNHDFSSICSIVKTKASTTSAAVFAMTSNMVAPWSVPLQPPTAAPSSNATEAARALASHSITCCKTVIAEVIEVRNGSIGCAVQASFQTEWIIVEAVVVNMVSVHRYFLNASLQTKWIIIEAVIINMASLNVRFQTRQASTNAVRA